MAANLGGGGDEPITDINVTPLVDIILVVLIIFMVTATTDIFTPSIKVNLPEAATGEATEVTSLGLQLTNDGKLHLDGEEIDEAALRAAIQAAHAEDEEVTCLIAADTEVPHGRVVWLLDVVKQEGVAKFAINIDPATAEAGRSM